MTREEHLVHCIEQRMLGYRLKFDLRRPDHARIHEFLEKGAKVSGLNFACNRMDFEQFVRARSGRMTRRDAKQGLVWHAVMYFAVSRWKEESKWHVGNCELAAIRKVCREYFEAVRRGTPGKKPTRAERATSV